MGSSLLPGTQRKPAPVCMVDSGCGTHTMIHINILFPGPTQLPYKEMEVDHPASYCLQYTGWELGYEVLFPYKEMKVDHLASK